MQVINYTELSRIISHALRHDPWLYELEPDEEGWVPLDQLVLALQSEKEEWRSLHADDIIAMIQESEKKRHEVKENKIRASYGHSLPGKIQKTKFCPPEYLFHGTSPDLIPSIQQSGLLPMSRQYVHLSVNTEEAQRVGKRKSPMPAILKIASAYAFQKGVNFYVGNEKIWLADFIPAEFIDFVKLQRK